MLISTESKEFYLLEIKGGWVEIITNNSFVAEQQKNYIMKI